MPSSFISSPAKVRWLKLHQQLRFSLLAKGRGLNQKINKIKCRPLYCRKKVGVICLCSVTHFLQMLLAQPHATSAQNCSIDGEAEASGNLSTGANYGATKKAGFGGWPEGCWWWNKSNNVNWAKKKITKKTSAVDSFSPVPPLGLGPSCSPWSLPCGWSALSWWCSTHSAGLVPCSLNYRTWRWVIHVEEWGMAGTRFDHTGFTRLSFKNDSWFSDWPDGRGSLPQIIAKLQDPITEGQRDEVPFPVRLLAIVEDQTVGIVGHENHCHADLLTAETA